MQTVTVSAKFQVVFPLAVRVVPLNTAVALLLTTLGGHQKMPSADSTIRATTHQGNKLMWTQDADPEDLKSARYFAQT